MENPMTSQSELKAIRDKLENMLAVLSGSRHDTRDLVLERSTDLSDAAQSEVAVDLAVQNLNQKWELSKSIEGALERISAGDYGHCASCGGAIHDKRLQAIPWATLCMSCQARQEAQQKLLDWPRAA
jgi:DnaK suppressor protein